MVDSVEYPSVTGLSLCAQSFQTRPLGPSGHNKQHLLCFVKWKSDSEEMFAAYVLGWFRMNNDEHRLSRKTLRGGASVTHLGTTPSRQSKMLQGDSESYSESEAESEYPWPKQHACAKMLVRSGLRCSSRNCLKRHEKATWQESPSPLGMVQRYATWSCHITYIYIQYDIISYI